MAGSFWDWNADLSVGIPDHINRFSKDQGVPKQKLFYHEVISG